MLRNRNNGQSRTMTNRPLYFILFILLIALATNACSSDIRFVRQSHKFVEDTVQKKDDTSKKEYKVNQVLRGTCSYYGKKFHGRKTANGETYDMYAFTAAHKTLPFNTILLIENLSNGKTVQVRINDRGPYKKGRILDLSYSAAKKIGMIGSGTAKITAKIVKLGK